MWKWGALAVGLVVLCAGCGGGGGDDERRFEVGVWEYFIRDPDPASAQRKLQQTADAGFRAAITNAFWQPGLTEPTEQEVVELRNAAAAAKEHGIRLLLIVQSPGSKTTPRTPQLRKEFTQFSVSLARQLPDYRDFIIGNEPNLNRFWLPQFGPDGENVAARDYLALLAESYDALKQVSEDIRVIGGALAPRGGDDPESSRQTHSPTQFIRDLGRYYKESGRDKPVMDAFAHHPYLDNSERPPDFAHPRTTTISLADYPKLVGLLGEAFDGTEQEGSDLPILYTEFGVQTKVPRGKLGAYTNRDVPAASDAVSQETQARYYEEAFKLACSQPTVEGMYIFHVWDEIDLLGWQSGVYFADQTPKLSRDTIADLPSCS